MNLLNVFNSIIDTGGATYNMRTRELNPDSGYIVAQKGFEKVFDFDGKLNTFQDQIQLYLTAEIWEQIYNRVDLYIGFWVNEEKIYFDIVERIPDIETAMREGRRNEQKAIWNATSKKEIFLSVQVSNDRDIETDKKY
jgi:hypothetical protein